MEMARREEEEEDNDVATSKEESSSTHLLYKYTHRERDLFLECASERRGAAHRVAAAQLAEQLPKYQPHSLVACVA